MQPLRPWRVAVGTLLGPRQPYGHTAMAMTYLLPRPWQPNWHASNAMGCSQDQGSPCGTDANAKATLWAHSQGQGMQQSRPRQEANAKACSSQGRGSPLDTHSRPRPATKAMAGPIGWLPRHACYQCQGPMNTYSSLRYAAPKAKARRHRHATVAKACMLSCLSLGYVRMGLPWP